MAASVAEPRRVLRHALVVDGGGGSPRAADLAIRGSVIEQIGEVAAQPGDIDHDVNGRLLMPGFIDAHSHTDALLFDEDVQLAQLRQGVTTVIGGQDGVSFAPGDGRYASEYFAAINGEHPRYRGDTVADLLATFDHTTRLNFAYLVPAGTVRNEVMGRDTSPATAEQLRRMRQLVATGLQHGAVGLSSGLDYVPGIFADTAELAALAEPVAQAGAVYVSHMRGGYEANSAEGTNEIARICAQSGVTAHISHFHAEADTLLPLLAELQEAGHDVSFDAYPYTRGCTLLAMPLLPPELSVRPAAEILEALSSPTRREALRTDWFPQVALKPSLGPLWPEMITLGHIAAPDFGWAHGLTLAAAAEKSGQDAIDFALDVLIASRLEVNAVMAVRFERSVAELGRIIASTSLLGGSDGIFVGAHPHPRARGTFARYLREYVREHGFLSWESAAVQLAARPAERFSLGRRGQLREGWLADVIVVDPKRVTDAATYENPLRVATGIDDVFVAGEPVLHGGRLTAALPGRGLRRATS
ncbi:N-acyl-D-amino-acid deacylase family protein [Glaciibacter psychrotolerans]|uniref:N-acyl-D-amino-acid deacylase n=1 Tax=Glaciibacter psychrotolerans TaxID=670054 RepID=A0A7Z0J759_9MICO|nr:amidohydrolase family protein [Leifsonia psychrotolerans]NYJ21277.1 N-acyl-D-amino-acid deacylase [Leifsonia psychrotolerans]